MITPFELLVGAAGDVRELEYISALMQTDVNVRQDCSLRGMLWSFIFSCLVRNALGGLAI